MERRTKPLLPLTGCGLYFAIALILKYSFVPPAAPPGQALLLHHPFSRIGTFGAALTLPELSAVADTPSDLARSPVVVYENNLPLGPGHAPHGEIAELGQGRFSHLNDAIVFSASDGTSANSNGRKYWAVIPRK
ncbi:hypothetical protein [Bradyrhizobium sp. CCGUVB14]|uniref:hypothetical protein n=1 Tax=Bradyrhizobium sp. CCGUVB14 TaxID=2949628 RepID=UPI0020B35CED|nr:hypothetical protein [Bradyrhizobium sp. CCGUVB14]MCP3445669.1 hypothetical protein [Bradyrhizobium sp. CCGUVB14]